MKANPGTLAKTIFLKFFVSHAILLTIIFLNSCQKDEKEEMFMELDDLATRSALASSTENYYGPVKFSISTKESFDESVQLERPDFDDYADFILKVQSGPHGKDKVKKIEISIDGIIVVSFDDFKKNASIVTKPLTGLNAVSTMRVKMEGSRGRFVVITIEASLKENSITDVDGNTYKIVKIGEQWWMAENLKTTKYTDGSDITNVTSNELWAISDDGAYCWYNNDVAYKEIYGALYNTGAARTTFQYNNKQLCPTGWHVPDGNDWNTLMLYLDHDAIYDWGCISTIAGGMLKEEGLSHWLSPNEGATNSTGFTAVPGGHRSYNDGTFSGIGMLGYYWGDGGFSYRAVHYEDASVTASETSGSGFSVRCIKNP